MTVTETAHTILNVRAIGPASLHLAWSGGVEAEFDATNTLKKRAFAALRDPTEFAKVEVGDWGHSIFWPVGAELGADSLWLETLSATGHGDVRAFLEWRLRHALSLSKAADALGVSRRMVAYYSSGEKKVPKPILLACRGWEVDEGQNYNFEDESSSVLAIELLEPVTGSAQRTISALFHTRADAEAAKNRLEAASLRVCHVDITDRTSAGYTENVGTGTTSPKSQGFWASLKGAFSPGEDRHVYEEGVRRGGALLTAIVDDDDTDKAVDILDNANSVDLDGRAEDWKKSGWIAPGAATGMAGIAAKSMMGDRKMGAGEDMIPVAEETLRVGKREVDRGGVRVRSYIVETPVSEQVSLHEVHVSVERRPGTGGTVPADAFRERTIEMTETAEEAVVAKNARVVEEVVVRKTADDRTETIGDTVRRTEVEVDNVAGTTRTGMTDAGTAGVRTAARVGLGDKISGLAKEGAGKVTGNDDLERKGEVQKGNSRY